MKQKTKKVTISEVAKEAGVSLQTVSRVINNRQEITPRTRQRVQEVIQRLRYQPNAIARSLSQRRSHTLGIVTSGLEYYGPARILVGVEQAAVQPRHPAPLPATVVASGQSGLTGVAPVPQWGKRS